MKINVIGLGYIGLPTALMLAANGNHTVGTDYNEVLVEQLKHGNVCFSEDGMEELYQKALDNGICFTGKYTAADIYIVAVPTPYKKSDKKIDTSYVVNAVQEIMRVCYDDSIIVIESTVSPGTIDTFIRPLIPQGMRVHLAHAPERIIPGNMIYELKNNHRVIGVDTERIGTTIKAAYETFCTGEIVITDIKTAEMIKVIENTYRDVNIAFANELAKICAVADVDVYEIIRIANMHPRANILMPGPGVGGHCISVDPWFLVGDYPGLANIILAARKINDSMPEYVLEKISCIMDEHKVTDISRVGLYGLTYKEDVDDIRESPTLQLLDCMKRHLASGVKVYDPYIKASVVSNQVHELRQFLEEVDIVVIMVGHREIIDSQSLLQDKIVFDTRNVIDISDKYVL